MATPINWEANPPPEDGNPRLLTAWAFENSWLVAKDKATEAAGYFDKATTAEGGPARMSPAPFSFTPNVVEPQVEIPRTAEAASLATFYELSTAVINQLAGLYTGWITEYLPDNTQYFDQAQAKISEMLTTGGTGINPHVEAQIWERDRSRILKDADRAEQEVIATWAARRFPLPPGAATWQVLQVRKDAGDKIAQASRDVAIKQAEIEIENVRFAVKEAKDLWLGAVNAAADYIKALSVGPNSAMQVVPSVTDSQSKLINAASDYYRARISVEELRLKASMPAAEYEQASRIKNGEWLMEQIKTQVSAAIAAAQSVGTQAAAALNSLHGSTGVSNSTQDSVSYSYSNDTMNAAPTITQVV